LPPRDNAAQRFGGLAQVYDRHRPGYPEAAIDYVCEAAVLKPKSLVADIGVGTGISARPFLERGCRVYGVEPNPDMLEVSRERLGSFAAYTPQTGDSSDTGLSDASVDLIVAAQAFHWFDKPKARAEFDRVLKPGGRIALLFNNRDVDSTPFLRAYEALLLEHSVDYAQVNHAQLPEEAFKSFFREYTYRWFPNVQPLDYDGLVGRVASCSYVPRAGEPGYDAMMDAVQRLYERHAHHGTVELRYRAEVYLDA